MVWQAVSLAALVIGVVALVIATGVLKRLSSRNADPSSVASRPASPWHPSRSGGSKGRRTRPRRDRMAFVVNPTKPGLAQLREAAYLASTARNLPEPLWLYTTTEDSGTVAAREAVAAGAELLVAAGGDGTVRAVASAAADSGLPMGVIPLGTGNLLARNLGLPLRDVATSLAIALDGDEIPIDVGWILITEESGEIIEQPFLVVAGIGLDAEMVAGAKASLKSRIGWLAYAVAALRHLRATRMLATVTVDDQAPVEKKMRTVLVANCGRLPAGLVLAPEARIDDGKLDIAILDARGGIAGWTELAGQVWLQGTRISAPSLPDSWRAGRIDHSRGSSVEIQTEAPQRIQVDGEPIGHASSLRAWVTPAAVTVRTASPTPRPKRRTPANRPPVERRRSV
jgi:diacylglycerol kinase (ATP)